MTAYLIVFAKIHDRDRFINEYGIPTAKLVAERGGEYLLRAPGVVSLEGGKFDGESAVISKWPDRATLEGFWHSPEYEALKKARAPLADCHVMMVEEP